MRSMNTATSLAMGVALVVGSLAVGRQSVSHPAIPGSTPARWFASVAPSPAVARTVAVPTAATNVREIFQCSSPGCPGHTNPSDRCSVSKCGKPGCPGHARKGDHCAYRCSSPDCPGHSRPEDTCW
jgi:hypothetical protein